MSNTPSSIVCFKNGYSFVCIPVSLDDETEKKSSEQVQSYTLGPVPDYRWCMELLVSSLLSLTASKYCHCQKHRKREKQPQF